MKITVVNYSRRKIGGAEQNLDVVLPELDRRGHRLQFVYFHDAPLDRAPVRAGENTDHVNVAAIGTSFALARVTAFQPDLINVHADIPPAFQAALQRIAPSAYSVHNYYGTCISGLKTHQFPIIQPCARSFGPGCLLQYFPRRCGGLSPVTMVNRYLLERERLQVMRDYDALITHSSHMEAEYRKHGFAPDRVHGLPYEVSFDSPATAGQQRSIEERPSLLFVGRMEKLKGGQVLIAALSQVQRTLQRPLDVHLAGDGPDRLQWQSLAALVEQRNPQIRVRFPGWVTGNELTGLFSRSHLLVVPSLWPEPFGKVGPEAARFGIPVAAFAVGGVTEWLIPGVNGIAAPGNPPTVSGLAQAIVDCLREPALYAGLCQGSLRSAERFKLDLHVDRLLALFEKVSHAPRARMALAG